MKHTNLELIKKIIININKNIDVNIKLSELKFVNKSVKSISLKKTENEFINLMSKLILYKKAKTKLKWSPKTNLKKLIDIMCEFELIKS